VDCTGVYLDDTYANTSDFLVTIDQTFGFFIPPWGSGNEKVEICNPDKTDCIVLKDENIWDLESSYFTSSGYRELNGKVIFFRYIVISFWGFNVKREDLCSYILLLYSNVYHQPYNH
jgi:hypothetical protein